MKGDLLFKTYYEPGLMCQGVNNVVLRLYKHSKGHIEDNPDNLTEVVFTPRDEVDDRITDIFQETGENRGISITSIVSVRAEQKLLFLLDCSLPVSDDNEVMLIEALNDSLEKLPAIKSGMLLRTKNSYHVVGFKPLSLENWHSHMAHAILLSTKSGIPIADVRYVGRSLQRSYGALRISDYCRKPTPDFICTI